MSSLALPAQAKELFQYLFEQASLGIAVEDLEGKVLLANPALCSMLGYRETELCGMNCCQFASPEDSQDDWALFQQLRAGAIDQYSLEKRYVRKDGVPLWGRLHVSLLKDIDGASPWSLPFWRTSRNGGGPKMRCEKANSAFVWRLMRERCSRMSGMRPAT